MTNPTLEINREEVQNEPEKSASSAKVNSPRKSASVNEEVKALVTHLREERLAQRYFKENPFAVLAVAAGVGYVLGGGLLSPFSRRIARIGMKAMVVPIAASQLKSIAGIEDPEKQ